jgi:hypothetical protein
MSLTPSFESARRARMAAGAEDAFWREHYDAYLREYPDQFVAVEKASRRFVTADPNLDRLISMIKDNGLDVQRVWVRYMAATPIHLAL